MPTRRVTPSTAGVSRASTRRAVRKHPPIQFVWRTKEWKVRKSIVKNDVELLYNIASNDHCVIKKVFKLEKDYEDKRTILHFEVRALQALPVCNRLVNMLVYVPGYPEPGYGMGIFDYCPLGDLRDWKKKSFDDKNFKPVPESYMWRFFVQMTQALAFIHGEIGPNTITRPSIIHRDIKPKNILVVDNGTTYPSFKLHDLGCGTMLEPGKGKRSAYCGTFDWQPPENPKINTKAADIWAIGACVHYLAIGRAPIKDVREFEKEIKTRYGREPPEVADYTSADRYYAARVPRQVTPINLTPDQQIQQRITPHVPGPKYYPTYSEEMNHWMGRALEMTPKARATTKQLIANMVPVATDMLKQLSGRPGLVDLEVKFGH